jgi:hypothetical protein
LCRHKKESEKDLAQIFVEHLGRWVVEVVGNFHSLRLGIRKKLRVLIRAAQQLKKIFERAHFGLTKV